MTSISPFTGDLGSGAVMSQVQKLAAMTAQGKDVKIIFGKECKTDGKNVYLCDISDKADQYHIDMLIHVMYHEVSHVLNTVFDVKSYMSYPAFPKYKELKFTCLNALEDIRIEKLISDDYPGVCVRMRNFINSMVDKEINKRFNSHDNMVKHLLDLSYLRGREIQVLEKGLEGFNLSVPNKIEALYVKYCKDIVEEAAQTIDTTGIRKCALRLYNNMLKLMKDSEEEPEDSPGDDKKSQPVSVGDILRLKGTDKYGKVLSIDGSTYEVEEITKSEAKKWLSGS